MGHGHWLGTRRIRCVNVLCDIVQIDCDVVYAKEVIVNDFGNLLHDSEERWESNAEFWDDYMGNDGNRWHRELISPTTEALLGNVAGLTVLDIACGNGNFSRRLAELGANVVAFDFSKTMIARAQKRSGQYAQRIQYHVVDATNYQDLVGLGIDSFHACVANMALMDIADIAPLFSALSRLLKRSAHFVFSIPHPCFQSPGMKKYVEQEEIENSIITRSSIMVYRYSESATHLGVGVRGQPVATRYFHRSMSTLLRYCFRESFVLDRLEEPVFEHHGCSDFQWTDIPPVMVLRLRSEKNAD